MRDHTRSRPRADARLPATEAGADTDTDTGIEADNAEAFAILHTHQ
ncbi:hypothetical protein [Kitasatospora sp. NPDC091207]